MLLFLMHLLGCFWFYIAIAGEQEVTWISEYDGGSGLDKPINIQYLYSIYWALTTLTTVGYGDITPTNDLERMYALGALLIGALVFGYLLSSVGSMMSNLDNRSNVVEEKLDQMQEVIRHTNMPSELAGRIRSYTEFCTRELCPRGLACVMCDKQAALQADVQLLLLLFLHCSHTWLIRTCVALLLTRMARITRVTLTPPCPRSVLTPRRSVLRSTLRADYSHNSVYDVEEVLSHLTPALDRQVKEFFLSKSVNTLPLLRVHDMDFKLEVMALCRCAPLTTSSLLSHRILLSSQLSLLRPSHQAGHVRGRGRRATKGIPQRRPPLPPARRGPRHLLRGPGAL